MAAAPKKTALAAAPAESAAPKGAPQALAAPTVALTDLQGELRAAAEQGLAEARSAYVKAKAAAEEAAGALETSCAAARAGVVAINLKALESLAANVEANFDFVKAALALDGFADFVALQGEFARGRLDAAADQAKTLAELAQKTAVDTLEPIKAQVAKSFKLAV